LIEKYQAIFQKLESLFHILYLQFGPSEKKLLDIAGIKYGKGLEASKLTFDEKYPVYGSNGIIGTLSTYDFSQSKIAISCRGASSGNIVLTKPRSTISSNSLVLNLFDDRLTLPLYSYLKRVNLQSYATGSAQPQITIENLQHLKVPSFSKIKIDNCDWLIKEYFLIQSKIEKLNNIKSKLLSKYF